jgi:hypothetical protein
MATAIKPQKAELINPNTGRRMNVDKSTYDLISKAIYHTLKKEGVITFTQLQEGVEKCLKEQKTKFEGNVGWYTVSIKHDMHARGVIEVFTEKGKKLHRIKK